jgi:hypothetical protein
MYCRAPDQALPQSPRWEGGLCSNLSMVRQNFHQYLPFTFFHLPGSSSYVPSLPSVPQMNGEQCLLPKITTECLIRRLSHEVRTGHGVCLSLSQSCSVLLAYASIFLFICLWISQKVVTNRLSPIRKKCTCNNSSYLTFREVNPIKLIRSTIFYVTFVIWCIFFLTQMMYTSYSNAIQHLGCMIVILHPT